MPSNEAKSREKSLGQWGKKWICFIKEYLEHWRDPCNLRNADLIDILHVWGFLRALES